MKKLIICIFAVFAAASAFAQSVEIENVGAGGKSEIKNVRLEDVGGGTFRLTIPKASVPDSTEKIFVRPDFAKAKAGDAGYFISPNGALTEFKQRKDGLLRDPSKMSFFGSKTPAGAYVGIVKGMRYNYMLNIKNAKNEYSQFVEFNVKDRKPYEDIIIDYTRLEGDDANYSGMGRAYRDWKLSTGQVKPIKEKIAYRPALDYCATAPEIRIRQGWKPAPPTVLKQTVENEPPMKVAVTFDRVGDIVRELKAQGVDKAEICLVGWNKSGHDGRYPQMFPVEPALGGEAKLRKLIGNTLADGYLMTCHTNSTDAYEIADCWDEEYIIKTPDGSLKKDSPWSGGQMYQVCWKRAYERFGAKDLKKVSELGFKGMHYIDVATCVQTRDCFDPKHPCNPDESARYMGKIFDYCNDTFGGSMSEGGYDHCFGSVDSVLYISFLLGKEGMPLVDRQIPIWQIVYHGIVLSNPGPFTMNYTIKDAKTRLKFIEFGGRPIFYFYSKFRTGASNWMGEADLLCATDAELKASVAKIKQAYETDKILGYLQYEFMEAHEEIADGVFSTRYSDGSEVVSNYTDKPFKYRYKVVEPMGWQLYKPSLLRRIANLF